MKPTITIVIPADSEPLVRQLLALHEELTQLALSSPEGTVVDACEAADVSFAATSEHLREMLGVRLAPGTARALVEGHGRAMAAFQPRDEATARDFRQAKGDVEFAVDAGKVNTREAGWKDLKIAVISKREAAAPRTPAQWQQERLPAATMVIAFAMIATAQAFRRCWRGTLRRLEVTAFAALHALGDAGRTHQMFSSFVAPASV